MPLTDEALDAILDSASALDLTEPSATQPVAPPSERTYGDPAPGDGPLLDEPDEAKVARAVERLWSSQDVLVARRNAQARVNELRRKGYSNVHLTKTPDRGWTTYAPPGSTPDAAPSLNKAATLCRRTSSLMFADPPAPDPQAPSGEDDDRASVEFTARVLEDLQGPNSLDTPRKLRRAFDKACSSASGFIRYRVDPHGGGRVPVEVEAVPWARSVAEATRDPVTGAAWTSSAPQAVLSNWDGEYAKRFVREDGSLTESEAEAATTWAPGVRSEVVDARNVRFIPHTAEDLWDADGVLIGFFVAWGDLRRMYPEELGATTPEQLAQILAWRPENYEDFAPDLRRRDLDVQANPDESLCFVLCLYHGQCEEYQYGAEVVVVGGRKVVKRGRWGWTPPGGRWETFLIPLSQEKQFGEGDDEPMGHAAMELLGSGNELLASMWGSYFDYLDDLNNRKTFLPMGSAIRAEQYAARGKRFIPVNPGGEPKQEQIPPYPVEAMNALSLIPQWMENAIGLEQAAQGLEDPSVRSAAQQQTIIAQVHAGLSELRQNTERAYVRCCQIELQLVRAFYSHERLLKVAGRDAEDRVEAWMAADLVGTTDVRLKPGTLSMLAPTQKAAVAFQWAAAGVITQAQLREFLSAGVGAMVGMQDDPHLRRVRRQASKWKQGPKQAVTPDQLLQYRAAKQAHAQAVALYQQQAAALAAQVQAEQVQAAAAGLPVAGQPFDPAQVLGPPPQPPANPFAAELAQIFDQRAVDVDSQVAQVRYVEWGRVMSSRDYEDHLPEWREGLDAEFQRARAALPQPAPVMAPQPRQKRGRTAVAG